ncbi:MAG TPA: NUDIX hydrolase [Burkholderiaceae bacterium]|nr:NUDIX hydrolase [Burkholderiaceae bacterium]
MDDHSSAAPSDTRATRFPVSVKAVLIQRDHVLLLKNERDEWELPGGKLELGEDVRDCLLREIWEETGLQAQVGQPLTSYVYLVAGTVPVLIVPFCCQADDFSRAQRSDEHKEIGIFPISGLDGINLPEGYRQTIAEALRERRRVS